MKKYHHCVKFTYPLSFQTRIPKVDQHTGGKWLIHGTKHRKDNQLQSHIISINGLVLLLPEPMLIYHQWAGLILGLHPANETCRYKVTPSLIGWAQT